MKPACRVLAVTSGGGHWVQLLRMKAAFEGHEVSYVTVQAEYAEQVAGAKFYAVRDATRWDRWGLMVMGWQLLRIIVRERPQVVITTGALPGLVALTLAKRLGAKTIWIDSIANVEELSMSGRHAQKVADVWLTQWSHLARPEGPRYEGGVL